MNRFAFAAALAAAGFSAGQAGAAETISVVSGTRLVAISTGGPVAQSFVATDSLLTDFAFQFTSTSQTITSGTVTFSLLAGSGTTGTALASQTTTVSGLAFRTGNTFSSVFTGSAGLVTGQTYTALLSGASNGLAILFGPNSNGSVDAYAPGKLFKNNSLDQACSNNTYCDANFRFTTAAVAGVPEPGTWAMLLAGFGALGFALRRRKAAAQLAIG